MHYFFRHLIRHDKSVLNTPLSLLLVVSGFYMFAFGMFSPLYALFVERMGGGITTASNAWAVFLLTSGLLTFVFGKLENKMREKKMAIMWSQLVVAVAYIIYYMAGSILMLYLAQAVMGVASAIFWPAFHSVYGAHVEKNKAAWQWSFYDGLAYLIPAVSAVIGGWLVTNYGFGFIFLIMAILSIVCGLFIFFLPRDLL